MNSRDPQKHIGLSGAVLLHRVNDIFAEAYKGMFEMAITAFMSFRLFSIYHLCV